MDIDVLKNTIKSNLVSFGLPSEKIEEITMQLLSDIIELLKKQ